jgi:hypothetical protein
LWCFYLQKKIELRCCYLDTAASPRHFAPRKQRSPTAQLRNLVAEPTMDGFMGSRYTVMLVKAVVWFGQASVKKRWGIDLLLRVHLDQGML